MLKAGFARMDITPSLGVSLKGYYRERICDGILDPLEINAVAFEEDGKKAVLLTADIPLAKPMKNSGLSYGQSAITANHNKGLPEELEEAIRIEKIYRETGDRELAAAAADKVYPKPGTIVAKACRIVELMDAPDSRELTLSAVSIGDVVFAGVPGEPFTDVGRAIKANSPYAVTLPTCNTNGKEGYFPTDFSEGSYEAATSRFKADTAERIINGFNELIQTL